MKKKLFAVGATLLSMFALTGCEEDPSTSSNDILTRAQGLVSDSSSYIPSYLDWNSFTFKSLRGGPDLKIYRVPGEGNAVPIETSRDAYDRSDVLVVALYEKDCEVCKQQAAWFDKLASEFPPENYRVDFAIVFMDIYEDSEDKSVEWMRGLSHAPAYTNVAEACVGGACKKVFMPLRTSPVAGGIYYVNRKDIRENEKAITWDTTVEPEKMYKSLKNHLAKHLGLIEVSFDADVTPVQNGGSDNPTF